MFGLNVGKQLKIIRGDKNLKKNDGKVEKIFFSLSFNFVKKKLLLDYFEFVVKKIFSLYLV